MSIFQPRQAMVLMVFLLVAEAAGGQEQTPALTHPHARQEHRPTAIRDYAADDAAAEIAADAYNQRDFERAYQLALKLAKQGNRRAQFILGDLYSVGDSPEQIQARIILGPSRNMNELPLDFFKAAAWYHKSAAQGFATAQARLGDLYREGRGVMQDYVAAATFYQHAADHGNASALLGLSYLYERGLGVDQDIAKAERLYKAGIQAAQELQTAKSPGSD